MGLFRTTPEIRGSRLQDGTSDERRRVWFLGSMSGGFSSRCALLRGCLSSVQGRNNVFAAKQIHSAQINSKSGGFRFGAVRRLFVCFGALRGALLLVLRVDELRVTSWQQIKSNRVRTPPNRTPDRTPDRTLIILRKSSRACQG